MFRSRKNLRFVRDPFVTGWNLKWKSPLFRNAFCSNRWNVLAKAAARLLLVPYEILRMSHESFCRNLGLHSSPSKEHCSRTFLLCVYTCKRRPCMRSLLHRSRFFTTHGLKYMIFVLVVLPLFAPLLIHSLSLYFLTRIYWPTISKI